MTISPEGDPTQQPWFQFASFVERHAFRPDSSVGGIKSGKWKLNTSDQLVPINKVAFDVFHEGWTEEEARKRKGSTSLWYEISFYWDDKEMFNIHFVDGQFISR